MKLYARFVKPVADRAVAAALLVVASPLLALLALVLAVQNRGTPFFRHTRIGRGGRAFDVIKFKTMRDLDTTAGKVQTDRERLTPVGAVIRKTSLDELPQMINVLKGDMSLIGPRPLVPEYLPYYSKHHARRHEVKPGITGLAQVAGRNRLPFSKRFDADVEYVDRVSLRLDLVILFRTLVAVFRSGDVTLGNDIREIDDVGLTRGLPDHYFHPRKE